MTLKIMEKRRCYLAVWLKGGAVRCFILVILKRQYEYDILTRFAYTGAYVKYCVYHFREVPHCYTVKRGDILFPVRRKSVILILRLNTVSYFFVNNSSFTLSLSY